MKIVGMWIGTLMGIVFGIPILVVFLGGFYTPLLLENVQAGSGSIQGIERQEELEKELVGILANMIPHTEHIENIKAHALIARTYLEKKRQGKSVDGTLQGISYQEMKKSWGEDFESIYAIYEEAVKATNGQVLWYEGELIEPVYHKESAGYTRDGVSLYDVEIPYLKSVESVGDGEILEKVMTKIEFVERLERAYPNIIIDQNLIEHQIQVIAKDSAGYIDSLQIGNLLIESEAFRTIIEIKSTCFSLSSSGETLIFKVKGVGHGVGLSQKGANAMAEGGKDYLEILKYYYQGVEIKTK